MNPNTGELAMKWINTNDKMPENLQRILFTTNAVNDQIQLATYVKKYSNEYGEIDNIFVARTKVFLGSMDH